MTHRSRTVPPVHAGLLFVRFLVAHLLTLAVGVALSLLSLPLWTGLLYRIQGRVPATSVPWAWYLLTLAPFYVVLSSLTILVAYLILTGAGDRLKSWQRVVRLTVWIHLVFLLPLNLFIGGRALP